MTIDEIAYAGGKYLKGLSSPYAWYYLNSAGGSITGDNWWWSMSPRDWSSGGSSHIWVVAGSNSPGYLSNGYVGATSTGVRPVISLERDVLWSDGNGSSSSPYRINYNKGHNGGSG